MRPLRLTHRTPGRKKDVQQGIADQISSMSIDQGSSAQGAAESEGMYINRALTSVITKGSQAQQAN